MRHLEQYLSSPVAFLSAASQRTSTIRLGTAVIPIRYENPVRLAEELGTVDLLSNGRLEIGTSSGLSEISVLLDSVLGVESSAEDPNAVTYETLLRFRDAVAGVPLAIGTGGYFDEGYPLIATPHSPTLAQRIWYGPGRRATAVMTGEFGLDLQISTLNTETTEDEFEVAQLEQIRVYREAYAKAGHTRTPRISVSRVVLPLLEGADNTELIAIAEKFANRVGSRFVSENSHAIQFGNPHIGHVDDIIESLLADVALAEATNLLITLPASLPLHLSRQVLHTVAQNIAPALGWTPSAAAPDIGYPGSRPADRTRVGA